jgi:hypothetical protein
VVPEISDSGSFLGATHTEHFPRLLQLKITTSKWEGR